MRDPDPGKAALAVIAIAILLAPGIVQMIVQELRARAKLRNLPPIRRHGDEK